MTYVWTHEGWLYLAAILDLCSRRVVGWATSANNDTDLALKALGRAKSSRLPMLGLVHHSDRGSVYASGDYRDALKALGAVASMSRKGNCWDNAVAESFFSTLKRELTRHESYFDHDEARRSLFEYIEVFYNRRRRHSTLGYRSPAEFEARLK